MFLLTNKLENYWVNITLWNNNHGILLRTFLTTFLKFNMNLRNSSLRSIEQLMELNLNSYTHLVSDSCHIFQKTLSPMISNIQVSNILLPSSPDTGHSPPGVLFSQPTADKQLERYKTGFTVLVVSLLMMVDLIVRVIAVILTFNYVAVIAHTRFAPYTTNLLSHAVNWKIINVFMVDNISAVSVGKWAVRHLNISPNKLLLKPM